MLRKVLGDDYHDSRFIKTIPKRGYRFEPDVQELLEEEKELVVEKRTRYSLALLEKSSGDGVSLARSSLARRTLVASAAVLVIAAALVWIAGRTQQNEELSALSKERFAGASNAEAFELYKRGRDLWRNRSAAGLHEATLLLEQAVEKDPNFALAYAALADAYAFDTGNWRKAEETAIRAIALAPNLGEPYASIGFVKLFWEWKPAEAEAHFKKAVSLSPDYATAHQWFAIKFAANRQFNQALAEMSRALELEPDSIAINADMCQMLYFLRRYDEAEAQCKRTLEIDANSFNAHRYLYQIYTAKGLHAEAVEEFFKSEALSVNHSTLPAHHKILKTAFERGGIRSFWQVQIDLLNNPVPDTGYTTAWYYALFGEKDKALLCLQRSYENRDFGFILFAADPVFSEFFEDPRYAELHARLF